MRKFHRGQLIDILHTLAEAIDYISNQEVIRSTVTLQLLEDLYSNAKFVIDFINSEHGHGTEAEKQLLVFVDMVHIAYTDETLGRKNIELLKEQMKEVLELVEEEIRVDRTEVVFFPYKADMWDCMESVYYAAKKDPTCDVYLVPIPWYKKNEDGTFGEMQYDGASFPENVEITDYKIYDLEARRPDVIFVHNPYDNHNSVTSVHPNYYCAQLRKSTECLVYIPYFVTGDDIEEHYCISSGTIYAHKTIVSSEKQRDKYIEVQKNEYRKSGVEISSTELLNRFIPLGSPKIDRVLNTKRKAGDLPDSWKKLIQREDGTSKTVLFYNTTVVTILKYGEKFLDKLREVIEICRLNEDIILWWRPHPLSFSTIESMRPQLADEYKKIVDKFRIEGWGIYDDSADLHRALVWSDAYYGDGSSIITLYQETGKPMMLQDVELVNRELSDEYLHSDAVVFGSKLISVSELAEQYPDYYTVVYPNLAEGQREYVLIPNLEFGNSMLHNFAYEFMSPQMKVKTIKDFSENEDINASYHPPIRIGDRLVFSPNQATKWAFYSVKEKKWTYEDVPKKYQPKILNHSSFGGGCVFGEEIIFNPGESGAFAKLDIQNGKISYYSAWYEQFEHYVTDINRGLLTAPMYYENKLMFASPQASIVIEIDPESMMITKEYKLGKQGDAYRTAYILPKSNKMYLIKLHTSEKFWNDTIVKWDIKTNELVEFSNLPIQLPNENTGNALNSFVFWKDILYVTPWQGDSLLKIDCKTDEITRHGLKPFFNFFERKNDYYKWAEGLAMPYIVFDPNRVRFSMQRPYDYSFWDIDFAKGEISNKRKYEFDDLKSAFMRSSKNQLRGWYDEETGFALKEYLELLTSKEHFAITKNMSMNTKRKDGMSGQRIYDYIKSCL